MTTHPTLTCWKVFEIRKLKKKCLLFNLFTEHKAIKVYFAFFGKFGMTYIVLYIFS